MTRTIVMLAALAVALPAAAQQSGQSGQTAAECTAARGELPKKWEGVAYADSGSTLAGVGLKAPIRIWGIQTPELLTPQNEESVPGMRARVLVEDMLEPADHRLSCQVLEWDRQCHMVAQCTVAADASKGGKAAPQDVALRLIEEGLAYGRGLGSALPWDADAGKRYARAEASARQGHKGLWSTWLGERQQAATSGFELRPIGEGINLKPLGRTDPKIIGGGSSGFDLKPAPQTK